MKIKLPSSETKIGVIGLGYVGLPLAFEFSKKYQVIGYDINKKRIEELEQFHDSTLEIDSSSLKSIKNLFFTNNQGDLEACDVYIITVPTPIDKHKQPDLSPLISASKLIGKIIKKGDIVIYESTVYPGATENQCIPVIEEESGLNLNIDFYAGYSPERINPGDKEHTVTKILKVTSGSSPDAAKFVDKLYGSIITAGTHLASSIKVAEAAKVIENTQRDVNIALVNELSIIFNKLEIDTLEVLEAAGTKWNFLPFRPGLVGGHCIGVDPYYLTHIAQYVGYHPEMILAGRRLNDGMGRFAVSLLIKTMMQKNINVEKSRILIMGLTFKEDCPDLRNTKVIDIYNELREYNINIDIFDPWCSKKEALEQFNINILESLPNTKYDGIIFAVAHSEFKNMSNNDIKKLCKSNSIVFDMKYILPKDQSDIRL